MLNNIPHKLRRVSTNKLQNSLSSLADMNKNCFLTFVAVGYIFGYKIMIRSLTFLEKWWKKRKQEELNRIANEEYDTSEDDDK